MSRSASILIPTQSFSRSLLILPGRIIERWFIIYMECFYECTALAGLLCNHNVTGEHVQVRVRINDEWICARSATSVWWFKDSRGRGFTVRTWCECQCEEINVTCTSLVWLTHEGNNGCCMWFWSCVYGDESSPCKRQNLFIFNTKVYIIN